MDSIIEFTNGVRLRQEYVALQNVHQFMLTLPMAVSATKSSWGYSITEGIPALDEIELIQHPAVTYSMGMTDEFLQYNNDDLEMVVCKSLIKYIDGHNPTHPFWPQARTDLINEYQSKWQGESKWPPLGHVPTWTHNDMSQSYTKFHHNVVNTIDDKPSFEQMSWHLPGYDCMTKFSCPAAGPECTGNKEHNAYSKNLKNNGAYIHQVIIHLNDVHKWPRNQVADWLDSLDIDLSFKVEEEV